MPFELPFESFPSERTVDLTATQLDAVAHRGGPLLIVAGAGSGKTRVLTSRIAHLISDHNVHPSQILAITFTNKAAGEMRERVSARVGRRARMMWVSTFHSACVRILRADAGALGYSQSFSIYDSDDSLRMITRVCKDLDLDPKRFPPRMFASAISNLKNELQDVDSVKRGEEETAEGERLELIAQVYREYQRRLKQANAMDFDDLICNTVWLLQTFPDIAVEYRKRFRHVLVDEYQDTNHAQYVLIKELVGPEGGPLPPAELCVVGDADQSIYAFRGATIRNITEFEQDFPNAHVVMLEQNFRSTQNILRAANAVISRNENRREKMLWTDAGDGDLITLYAADDENEEAAFIVREMARLRDSGTPLQDMAVMYRTNAQSRALEEQLMRANLRYRLIGGVRFYERREIRDAIAYLKVLANPADEVAVRRILNVPKRGIGDRAEQAVETLALRERIGFFDALRLVEQAPGIASRSASAVQGFVRLIDELTDLVTQGVGPGDVLEAIIDKTGIGRELQLSNDPQDEGRLENLSELVDVARGYEHALASQELLEGEEPVYPTVAGFLENVSLVADSDSLPDDGDGVVTLMTLHTAKGLEFPVVFLTGLEEGVFPHIRSLNDPVELEEERRLAYVGITRAMKRLYLTRAASRSVWGSPQYAIASRFLDEIPRSVLDEQRIAAPRFTQVRESDSTAAYGGRAPIKTARTAFGSGAKDSGPRLHEHEVEIGDRVNHETYGLGKVIGIAGSGERAQVTVDFGSAGEKRLLLRYAPLEKL
ncbi:MAG: DNA helicase PcrA [Actinomycetales bacterium]|nr:DNA helicase PcrA [Actinomycetales bacterium]